MPAMHILVYVQITKTHPCVFGLITHNIQKYCIIKLLGHALKLPAKHFAGAAALCLAHKNNESAWVLLNDVLELLRRVQLHPRVGC